MTFLRVEEAALKGECEEFRRNVLVPRRVGEVVVWVGSGIIFRTVRETALAVRYGDDIVGPAWYVLNELVILRSPRDVVQAVLLPLTHSILVLCPYLLVCNLRLSLEHEDDFTGYGSLDASVTRSVYTKSQAAHIGSPGPDDEPDLQGTGTV